MRFWAGLVVLCGAVTFALSGCASYDNSGSGPGVQSESNSGRQRGEFYQTETLTPGVGSALFPDPAWR